MPKSLSDFGNYFQAVFLDGSQRLLTVFDVIGFAIFIFPEITGFFEMDRISRYAVGGGIFLISFIIANFNLYRNTRTHQDFTIEKIGTTSGYLSGSIFTFASNEISILSSFLLVIRSNIRISKSGPGTSVEIYIENIEPFCIGDTSIKDIDVTLKSRPAENYQYSIHENPYRLDPNDSKTLTFEARIPCDTECIEKHYGSLANFREISLTVAAKPTGQNPHFMEIISNLTPMHTGIEEELSTKIGHLQSAKLSSKDMLQIMKRYWGAN